MKKVYALLALTLLSLSCVTLMPTAEPEPTREPVVEISTTDPNQPVEVQAGETFEIVIESNPTTGYHWEIVGGLDENIIQFVSSDYKNEEPITIGSGGVDIWTFKAASAGQTLLTLGSFPPSLDATEPERTVLFNIIVK